MEEKATQLQLRGDDTEHNDVFIGAPREVTVDQERNTLRVHDGQTVGGHELLRADLENLVPGSIDAGDIVIDVDDGEESSSITLPEYFQRIVKPAQGSNATDVNVIPPEGMQSTDMQSLVSEFTEMFKAFALNNSPSLTGEPQAPTPDTSDASKRIATTSFVKALVDVVKQTADAAKTDASTAKTSATNALNTANSATTLANSALSRANASFNKTFGGIDSIALINTSLGYFGNKGKTVNIGGVVSSCTYAVVETIGDLNVSFSFSTAPGSWVVLTQGSVYFGGASHSQSASIVCLAVRIS